MDTLNLDVILRGAARGVFTVLSPQKRQVSHSRQVGYSASTEVQEGVYQLVT